MNLETILAPVFGPLLLLPAWSAVIIVSVLTTVLITFMYKWMTNQKEMKHMKAQMKHHQKEMKECKNNVNKMMEINKKVMSINMNYMKQSLKPTIVTFIPIIIIFAWLNATLAYDPIMPGQEFTTTMDFQKGIFGEAHLTTTDSITILNNATAKINQETRKAIWTLKAEKEGKTSIEYEYEGKTYIKEVIITKEQKYLPVLTIVNDGYVKQIKVDNSPLVIFHVFGFGFTWLWTYILLSLILGLGLRKIFSIY